MYDNVQTHSFPNRFRRLTRLCAMSIDVQISERLYPYMRKLSTPKVGVSISLLFGTPSSFRRSKKFWHSVTMSAHSANARPEYLAVLKFSGAGFNGLTSAVTPWWICRRICAGAGSVGFDKCLFLLGIVGRSSHSKENLKEND